MTLGDVTNTIETQKFVTQKFFHFSTWDKNYNVLLKIYFNFHVAVHDLAH